MCSGATGCITNGGRPPRLHWGNALGPTRSPAGAQGLRHPVRSSWRPCPSWTCPGDFADRRDGGKGCRVRGIPYALLRLPSAHPSNTRSRKSRDGIWESQGSRALLPHHLTDPGRLLSSQPHHPRLGIWIRSGIGAAPRHHPVTISTMASGLGWNHLPSAYMWCTVCAGSRRSWVHAQVLCFIPGSGFLSV